MVSKLSITTSGYPSLLRAVSRFSRGLAPCPCTSGGGSGPDSLALQAATAARRTGSNGFVSSRARHAALTRMSVAACASRVQCQLPLLRMQRVPAVSSLSKTVVNSHRRTCTSIGKPSMHEVLVQGLTQHVCRQLRPVGLQQRLQII
jgi:hypothetical protein